MDVVLKRLLILVVGTQPVQFRINILNNFLELRTKPLTICAVLGKMLMALRFGRKAVCNFDVYDIDDRAPMAAHLCTLPTASRLGVPDFAQPRYPIK
ncbi:hypothetical protein SAMN04490196_1794 [Pseudomonas moraviensis]|nr:hypothetical protein SAMN04490196_1794 [Pseudomonas moraviensis]